MVGYAYVEGKDITYLKKTRNVKIGHRGKNEEGDEYSYIGGDTQQRKKRLCPHHRKGKQGNKRDSTDSQIKVEAVTGAVELNFL